MILIFFLSSLILSLVVYFAKNNFVTRAVILVFLLSLIGFTVYAYIHLNEVSGVYYKFDALGVMLTSILTLISIFAFYHSILYLKRKNSTTKQKSLYYAMLIVFISAIISAYLVENIALLWVSIEATSLLVSILLYHIRDKDTLEATWKYLFVSSLSLAIAFIGILFLSIAANTVGVHDLNISNLLSIAKNLDTNWIKIAFLLIVIGLSVKLNAFPFYAVAVDAKTIAASPINALMSTALVNVGFVGIFRMFSIIARTDAMQWAQNVLMLMGVFSIIIATVQLTRIKRLKRMLAFSSMEHMGIVLIGMAVGEIGLYGAILHIIFHSFIKSGLSFQVGAIRHFYKFIWIKDSGNYFKLNPIGGLTFIIGIFSILAIPPSGLFVSEFYVFKALFLNSNYFVAVFVLLLLTSIIYTIGKITLPLLFGEVNEDNLEPGVKPNFYENISQFLFFGLVFYLGINPPLFFTDLIKMAMSVIN